MAILLEEIERIDNPAWKYKIYNDLGVCYFKQNKVDEAVTIWKECEAGLREIGEYNTIRHFRILFNQMVASLEGEHRFSKYEVEWEKLGDEIYHNIHENGWEYFGYRIIRIYFCE